VRYNSFYVLTNNIDTHGLAYAKALQQLMTGVYLGEVCLLGLFAINTAPGPIVLMAVFLGGTAIYHAIMRHALRPLTRYLPDGLEGPHMNSLFSTSDHKSYDASKAGFPPSEAETVAPKKMVAKRADLFSRIFDPRKFKSFKSVRVLVPDYPGPIYEEEDAETAYLDPAVTRQVPRLWIVRDEMGISVRECQECREIVPISDAYATFNEKGKVVWDPMEMEGSLQDVPIWEKRVDY
jgi:hypothetical protein